VRDFDLPFCSSCNKNWFTIQRIDAERLGFIVPGCCKRQRSRRANNFDWALQLKRIDIGKQMHELRVRVGIGVRSLGSISA
jgi:hypothetical protein